MLNASASRAAKQGGTSPTVAEDTRPQAQRIEPNGLDRMSALSDIASFFTTGEHA